MPPFCTKTTDYLAGKARLCPADRPPVRAQDRPFNRLHDGTNDRLRNLFYALLRDLPSIKRWTRRGVSTAALLLMVPPSAADWTDSTSPDADKPAAISVYFQDDPHAAFKTLEKRAQAGDAIAQYFMGKAWLQGHGTHVDAAIAYAWFAASAANGHWPGRQARRRLHPRLRVGELPRGERLARRFVSRYSTLRVPTSPCFTSLTGDRVDTCNHNGRAQQPAQD